MCKLEFWIATRDLYYHIRELQQIFTSFFGAMFCKPSVQSDFTWANGASTISRTVSRWILIYFGVTLGMAISSLVGSSNWKS